MIDFLVCTAAVVLENVVLLGTGCQDELLYHGLILLVRYMARFVSVLLALHTSISARSSSGMSTSFSPWYFGITSCPANNEISTNSSTTLGWVVGNIGGIVRTIDVRHDRGSEG